MIALALGVLIVAAAWFVHVRVFPWKDCPWCGGGRRIRSGTAHRDCGRCGTSGRVRRLGAGRES